MKLWFKCGLLFLIIFLYYCEMWQMRYTSIEVIKWDSKWIFSRSAYLFGILIKNPLYCAVMLFYELWLGFLSWLSSTFSDIFSYIYRVSQKKRYQLPLKSAIFGSHGWKFGVTLIRVCRIRILNQIGPITFRNTPKSRSKNRKITKNRFVRFLSISSSNRLGIGDIFTPTPDLRSKNYSPIFSEFKTIFRLKIVWNFARFSKIEGNFNWFSIWKQLG